MENRYLIDDFQLWGLESSASCAICSLARGAGVQAEDRLEEAELVQVSEPRVMVKGARHIHSRRLQKAISCST